MSKENDKKIVDRVVRVLEVAGNHDMPPVRALAAAAAAVVAVLKHDTAPEGNNK